LCLLVVAEAIAVVHSLDFDAHRLGEPCKICISLAGSGSAPPAATPALVRPQVTGVPIAADSSPVVGIRRLERPAVRGPPAVS
jgi:hypothetical protein